MRKHEIMPQYLTLGLYLSARIVPGRSFERTIDPREDLDRDIDMSNILPVLKSSRSLSSNHQVVNYLDRLTLVTRWQPSWQREAKLVAFALSRMQLEINEEDRLWCSE